MKKIFIFMILSFMATSLFASELGEKDSRCIYTKCEMDRSVAQSLAKGDQPAPKQKGKKAKTMAK